MVKMVDTPMRSFTSSIPANPQAWVLVHGAWHGGWCWDKVVALLQARALFASAPTLTGLAERESELSRRVTLETHVEDIVKHVRSLQRADITLVAHSYGGFPATLAAKKLGGIVRHLILLDAFLPINKERVLDHAPQLIDSYTASVLADKKWHIPPLPSEMFGVDKADRMWVDALLTPQPVNTYFHAAELPFTIDKFRKSYIRCLQAPGDLLSRSLERIHADSSWKYYEIDAPHDVMITAPERLVKLLLQL
ncbi:alpha/beta fold hydrolase [Rahnella inusitata]|uniref:alpha/beta fold hydrolase n=1 Tax=Rahnella TaxID=34037 RepID=UPI0039B05BC7